MPILPSEFDSYSSYDLLREAEAGRIGFDQRLIDSLSARPEESLADLARFSNEIHDDALLDCGEQVFDLFRHFNSPLAIPFYLRLAAPSEEGIPDDVVEAFTALSEPAIDPLLGAIAAAGDDDRADLVFILAALAVHDERVRAVLEETLRTDPYEGALCVGLNGDPALRPAVEAALAELPADEQWIEERKALELCLGQLDAAPAERDRPEFDIRRLYAPASPPLFSALPESLVEEYLACPLAEYRRDAALSLCDEVYNDDTCEALLRQAREDSEAEVRAACLRALGSVVEQNSAVRDFLLEVLAKPDLSPAERAAATVALATETGRSAVHESIHALYEAPETRADAIEAMWRTHDLRYRKYFSENLQHADPLVRRAAVTAVGVYPIEELAAELVPLFEDEETRDQALFSYALAAPGKTSEKAVQKLFEKIDELSGGLTPAESESVGTALDARLEREGLERVFFPEEEDDKEQGEDSGHGHVHGPDCNHGPATIMAAGPTPGRNEPCPCGSGKKYKKCHGT